MVLLRRDGEAHYVIIDDGHVVEGQIESILHVLDRYRDGFGPDDQRPYLVITSGGLQISLAVMRHWEKFYNMILIKDEGRGHYVTVACNDRAPFVTGQMFDDLSLCFRTAKSALHFRSRFPAKSK